MTGPGSRVAGAAPGGPSAPGTGPEAPARRALHADVTIAGVIVALCALVWAGTLTFEEVPAALAQGMGPGAFPRLILGVMIALALWLGISSRGRRDAVREPVHRMVYLTGLAGLAFLAVLQLFGLYAATLFAVLGIGRLWGERRWALLAAVAVGLALTIHLVFVRGFGIALPRGVVGAWLA